MLGRVGVVEREGVFGRAPIEGLPVEGRLIDRLPVEGRLMDGDRLGAENEPPPRDIPPPENPPPPRDMPPPPREPPPRPPGPRAATSLTISAAKATKHNVFAANRFISLCLSKCVFGLVISFEHA